MSDSPATPATESEKTASAAEVEFTSKLEQLLSDFDVKGIIIYQLPDDLQGEKPTFHSLSRGHFYDTSLLVNSYVKEMKQKIMHDLDGLA